MKVYRSGAGFLHCKCVADFRKDSRFATIPDDVKAFDVPSDVLSGEVCDICGYELLTVNEHTVERGGL